MHPPPTITASAVCFILAQLPRIVLELPLFVLAADALRSRADPFRSALFVRGAEIQRVKERDSPPVRASVVNGSEQLRAGLQAPAGGPFHLLHDAQDVAAENLFDVRL